MIGRESAAVTVWLCPPGQWTAQSAQSACLPWLDTTERQRWSRFVFDRDRHVYLVAHGLLRWALSTTMPAIAPSGWRFATDTFGRPGLAGDHDAQGLSFSLSHTRCMTAVAIGKNCEVGIDVETLRETVDGTLRAATTAFAMEERNWLERRSPAECARSILRLWTLKEAYVKARGLGLHLPLEVFSFALDEHRGVHGFRPPTDRRDDGSWYFLEAQPRDCRLALAYHPLNGDDMPFVTVQLGITVAGRWASRCTGRVRLAAVPGRLS